jgi:DNA-binding CsgD family transcriptional regulator
MTPQQSSRRFDQKVRPICHDFILMLEMLGAEDITQRLNTLSPQERLVLDLMVRGNGNKQIAALLEVEITTVKAHNIRIFRKLRVNSRVQATVFWLWARLFTGESNTNAPTADWISKRLWGDEPPQPSKDATQTIDSGIHAQTSR